MTAATVTKAKSASTRKKAETNSSKKLKARRAVEDHLERMRLEKENNDYCFDF
jgi:hypothetical protein